MERRADYLQRLFNGSAPWVECYYQMGVSILSEHLKTVSEVLIHGTRPHHYTHPSNWKQRKVEKEDQERDRFAQESIAFIKGTGLEIVIESYGIDIDPKKFRETYFDWIEYRKRCLKSQST